MNTENIHTIPPADRVIAFGAFDPFHAGHLAYLSQAATLGQELFVVVARDVSIRTLKHHEPYQTEGVRLKIIQENLPQAHVVLGDETDFLRPIKDIVPDILALGYDQRLPISEEHLTQEFPYLRIIRLAPFEADLYKSSKIVTHQSLDWYQ